MTILDLIPNLKRMATTGGGEYSGLCPFCGGRLSERPDRVFRVWPSEGTTGRYWCRSCGKHGDGLQLLRDMKGLSFPEALKSWGLPSTWKPGHLSERATTTGATWTPRQGTAPGNTWQDRAASFLAGCQKSLWGPSGYECRAFLSDRGLKPETIKAAGLGWNPGDRYQDRAEWGLDPLLNEDGKPKKIWLPFGLVIPCIDKGRVIRLRVRRPNPGDGPRYVIISGSGSTPLTLGTGRAWVVVESEIDGLLLHQEAGDLAGVIALGSAQARPDHETDRALKEAGLILVSLDSDRAGASEAWGFWKRTYPGFKRWPCPVGKDPSGAKQAGLDLRTWVMAGLPIEPETKETTTAPAQDQATANQEGTHATQTRDEGKDKGSDRRNEFKPFPSDWKTRFDERTLERLAIMTVDGGLSDEEAERRVLH